MKIFLGSQIRKWDLFTMENDNISSLQLMERAAQSSVNWLFTNFDSTISYSVFCGQGNNGGDGFAIARLLNDKGCDVRVFTDDHQKFSEDALVNFQKCKELSRIEIFSFDQVKEFEFEENSVIIDALFGIGLNRNIEGDFKDLINFLNDLPFPKVSIDIPSGLMADKIIAENATVFKADETLTFQTWKKAMFHPETGVFCGNIHIIDIFLSDEFNANEESNDFVIGEQLIHEIYKIRNEFSNKGTYGKVTIAAGSVGKIGAALMATKAALRSGSGLTFVLAPQCGYEILQSSCPEAMFISGGEDCIVDFNYEENSVIGVGAGLGTDLETESSFMEFLKNYHKPLVIDADSLNIIAKHTQFIKRIPKNSIITPHPKEFERLFGKTTNSFERLKLARRQAQELQIYIVLKDHYTQIVTPDNKVYYNVTGNSGMAKGGSGDVLLGIITSLLAQHYSQEHAAIFGVWMHGKAGDFAAEICSKEAMLPSDLIDELGTVFKYLN